MAVTPPPTPLHIFTVEEANIAESLRPIVKQLLKDAGKNYSIWFFSDGLTSCGANGTPWVIIERNGNVGTISEGPFFASISVEFSIKPSRATGSSLDVRTAVPKNGEDIPERMSDEEIIESAAVATGDSYRNFATGGKKLPNHGWAHFDWCREKLSKIEL